jgi:hypothetical protein
LLSWLWSIWRKIWDSWNGFISLLDGEQTGDVDLGGSGPGTGESRRRQRPKWGMISLKIWWLL